MQALKKRKSLSNLKQKRVYFNKVHSFYLRIYKVSYSSD